MKLKRSRVLKVVNNRFQKLGLAAHNENVEMTDDQIAGFIDNQLLEQFPLTQQAFNEFRQARQALTFLSVSEKSLKDMLGLPQYRKDGIEHKKKRTVYPTDNKLFSLLGKTLVDFCRANYPGAIRQLAKD